MIVSIRVAKKQHQLVHLLCKWLSSREISTSTFSKTLLIFFVLQVSCDCLLAMVDNTETACFHRQIKSCDSGHFDAHGID